MNKKLMAAAVAGALAIPGIALAQSSVTLYGTIDTGIRNQSKVITPTGDGTRTSITDGLNTTNRWGMTGSEDLGGGLKANFKLEGQYSSDTGAGPAGGATFARTSKVGLSSGANSFDLGRDYTVNFKELGIYDPMSYNYTGIMPNAAPFTAGVRSSNMITAATGFNGFNLRAEYALGEVTGSSAAGSRFGIGADFGTGPVTVAGAYSTTKNVANDASQKDMTIGVKYVMEAFTFRAGYADTKWDALFPSTLDKARMFMLGVGYDFSSRVTGRIGYYDIKDTGFAAPADGKKKDSIIAVDYHLSKRTNLYAELDHHSFTGNVGTQNSIDGVASNDGTTGVGVGIAHSF